MNPNPKAKKVTTPMVHTSSKSISMAPFCPRCHGRPLDGACLMVFCIFEALLNLQAMRLGIFSTGSLIDFDPTDEATGKLVKLFE